MNVADKSAMFTLSLLTVLTITTCDYYLLHWYYIQLVQESPENISKPMKSGVIQGIEMLYKVFRKESDNEKKISKEVEIRWAPSFDIKYKYF